MSNTVTVTFAFDIGDLVYFVDAPNRLNERPRPFCVYERLAQECHGGVQKLYKITGYRDVISETCLQKTPPPYEPQTKDEMRCRQVEEMERLQVATEVRAACYPFDLSASTNDTPPEDVIPPDDD